MIIKVSQCTTKYLQCNSNSTNNEGNIMKVWSACYNWSLSKIY